MEGENPSRSSRREEYEAFEEKVKRTVYVDNLSTSVTESVLTMALGQFGSVKAVHFIPNLVVTGNPPQCALVEMENAKQARAVISIVAEFPFMISGMPRPVRALQARPEMFEDRPPLPGRRIECRWIDPDDPDAKRLKFLTSKHSAEATFMLKQQQAEEAALAKRQHDTLKGSYKKFELMNSVMSDKTAYALARHYGLKIGDH